MRPAWALAAVLLAGCAQVSEPLASCAVLLEWQGPPTDGAGLEPFPYAGAPLAQATWNGTPVFVAALQGTHAPAEWPLTVHFHHRMGHAQMDARTQTPLDRDLAPEVRAAYREALLDLGVPADEAEVLAQRVFYDDQSASGDCAPGTKRSCHGEIRWTFPSVEWNRSEPATSVLQAPGNVTMHLDLGADGAALAVQDLVGHKVPAGALPDGLGAFTWNGLGVAQRFGHEGPYGHLQVSATGHALWNGTVLDRPGGVQEGLARHLSSLGLSVPTVADVEVRDSDCAGDASG